MYIIFFTYTVAYSHPDLDFRSCSCHLFFGFPMIYPGEHFNLQRINQPRKKWWNLATPQHLVYFLPGIICAASCCAQLYPGSRVHASAANCTCFVGPWGSSFSGDWHRCWRELVAWYLDLLRFTAQVNSPVVAARNMFNCLGAFKTQHENYSFLTQLRNLSNLYEHSYWH